MQEPPEREQHTSDGEQEPKGPSENSPSEQGREEAGTPSSENLRRSQRKRKSVSTDESTPHRSKTPRQARRQKMAGVTRSPGASKGGAKAGGSTPKTQADPTPTESVILREIRELKVGGARD